MALTVSGNEITDAVRATAAAGDGLASPDSSFGIWEATTNLCTNGGFESNTTGWTGVTRVTSQAKFGSASGEVSPGTAPASFGITLTAAAYTASCWIYIPAAYDGTQVQIAFANFASATGTLTANANMAITDEWQKVDCPGATPNAGDLAGHIVVQDTGAPTSAIYIDGVQVEAQPLATPYVETNGGTASRSNASVQIPVAGLFTASQGWAAVRVRMGFSNSTEPAGFPYVMNWQDNTSNRISMLYDGSSNTFGIQRYSGGVFTGSSKAQALAIGDLITVVFAWESARLRVSVNGSVFSNNTAVTVPTLSATTAYILSSSGTSSHFDSDVFWLVCGRGTLTDADAAALDALGNTDPTYSDLPVAADISAIVPFDSGAYTIYPNSPSGGLEAGGAVSPTLIALPHGNITFGMPTINNELAAIPASIVTIREELK